MHEREEILKYLKKQNGYVTYKSVAANFKLDAKDDTALMNNILFTFNASRIGQTYAEFEESGHEYAYIEFVTNGVQNAANSIGGSINKALPTIGHMSRDIFSDGGWHFRGGVVTPVGNVSGGATSTDFYVAPNGDVIPATQQEVNDNLSQMNNQNGKYVGEAIRDAVRVRVENAHSVDPGFNGTPNPDL